MPPMSSDNAPNKPPNAPSNADGAGPAAHPVLELEQVCKTFRVRGAGHGETVELKAVSDISFAVSRGECLGLVGESGCGKSTLGRLCCGLLQPTAGSVRFDGQILPPAGPDSPVAGRLQMVFQDPWSSLNPRVRAGDSVAEGLEAACWQKRFPGALAAKSIASRVAEMFETVGLAGMERRYPHEFSGGQRQRIALARALVTSPDLVVCDEPVSALDASVQAQVLNAMRDLQERFGQTLLFISHNLAVVGFMCPRILVMYLGEIVEELDRERLEQGAHPYTRALAQAMPDRSGIGKKPLPVLGEIPSPLNPPSGCHFHPRCPRATELCAAEAPAWTEFEAGWRVRCHHPG